MTAEQDRVRWNGRYRQRTPSFTPHPLVAHAAEAGLPSGPVLELACGPSGSALTLAAGGRAVTAVDVSDVALEQLRTEAERRGLAARLTCVRADAGAALSAHAGPWAMVLATLFWDAGVFTAAAGAVAPGGLLAWEALRAPDEPSRDAPHPYRVPHGQPARLLPDRFTVAWQAAGETTTRLLARARF